MNEPNSFRQNAVGPDCRVVVLGAGQAGAQVCFSLRQSGFAGAVTLVGDEPVLPYQRPPLSKTYLKGETELDRLFIKPAAWYETNGVDTLLNTRAEAIDRANKQVRLSSSASLDYDRLVLALGARPRVLPVSGAKLSGVFDMRSLADANALRPHLVPGKHMVIVGGGYIGLEAAAVARQLGVEATVLEMADRVLARVAGAAVSEQISALHKRHGVNIRTRVRLSALEGRNGAVTGAILDNGETVPTDLVLTGIGVLPNQEIGNEAGLACGEGVQVDEDARTSDENVFAVGDCASRPLVHYGGVRGRLESVHNAIEQGKLAAAAILNLQRPTIAAPWFWSEQYETVLQTVGLYGDHDEAIIRGDADSGSFSVYYFKQGQLIAVDAFNSPPDFVMAKKWVADGAKLMRSQVADLSIPLRQIQLAE